MMKFTFNLVSSISVNNFIHTFTKYTSFPPLVREKRDEEDTNKLVSTYWDFGMKNPSTIVLLFVQLY